MTFTQSSYTVSVHIFGFLRTHVDSQGLSYAFEKEIAQEGETAYDIARELRIPPEKIEGIFLNGRVKNIHDLVFPGDRLAFFPQGTPGPYRVFLGMARENVERARREKEKASKRHR